MVSTLVSLRDSVDPAVLRQLAVIRRLPLRVVGDCMLPILADGQVVEVEPASCYLPGDVVVIRRPSTGQLLVHRILGYRPSAWRWELVVQGDGCATHDGAVLPEHVIGKVCAVDGSRNQPLVSVRDRVRSGGRWLHLTLGWLLRRLV